MSSKEREFLIAVVKKDTETKLHTLALLTPLAFAIIKETDMNIDVVDISSSGPNMKYEDHRF